MSATKSYSILCPKCNENTNHLPAQKGGARVAYKIWKLTVFFVSFGMVYPHAFTDDDDEFMVSCTKCGTNAKTAK